MFETPYVMKLAQNIARHAGARQAQIAKNVANADVPGYRSRDLLDFSETFRQSGSELRKTRAKHMTGGASTQNFATFDVGGQASPNGNNVSVEEEMVRAARAKSAHNTALTVYRTSLGILRSSIGRNG